jgi:hypothetical protein
MGANTASGQSERYRGLPLTGIQEGSDMRAENTPEDMLLRVMRVAELLIGEKRVPPTKLAYLTDDSLASPAMPDTMEASRKRVSKTRKRKSGVHSS